MRDGVESSNEIIFCIDGHQVKNLGHVCLYNDFKSNYKHKIDQWMTDLQNLRGETHLQLR